AVRRQLRRQHVSGVDVVGYSAGGVIARLWVRDHGGDDLARRIITLGSPHHGTFLAGYRNRAVECPKACKQLAPRSGLLARLGGGDETPTGPDWVSIWSDDDEVVTPPSSARLHGAVNISVQDICGKVVVAHRDLPRNREVMGLVSYELSAAVPTVPRVTACSVVR
ncbi:MAG: lipase, partial [Propionibacteriales bacterium]|nr:lipase [Propionibacteriales bacterium]